MSTRRARIKAVTSLPPRRKNAEQVDNKNKPNQLKDDINNVMKSPRTPRAAVLKDHDKISPAKFASPLPHDITRENISKAPVLEAASPKIASTVRSPEKCILTPKIAEKVPVITKTSAILSALTQSPKKTVVNAVRSLPQVSSPKVVNIVPRNTDKKPTPGQSAEFKENVEVVVRQNKNKNTGQKKNDVPEDYNVPSVPESITDDVMDGIIPLHPANVGPKPIAFLKNEIISENAEVLFDPIVPLPSPSKVRPKLRPVPRLAPLRRSSIQGSASESEDESRRVLLSSGALTPAPPRQRHDSHTSHSTLQSLPNRELNRVRNDSVCSSVSQVNAALPVAASPLKEKMSKSRRQEISRRMSAMRRRRETVMRDKLTMYDLIFYNPSSNPIIPDQDEITAKEENAKEAEKAATKSEENVDDPPTEAAPVPQIKLGPNGEIILDEQSLVIKQTDSDRKVSSVVREGSWGGGGKYKKCARTAEWSNAETVRFYRALAALGTDFTLMARLFPDRNRRELKFKFKKEERLNGAQVDKALMSATAWDAEGLELEFKEERATAAKRIAMQKERLLQEKQAERDRLRASRELKVRRSRGAKALESTMLPGVNNSKENSLLTANEIIEQALKNKAELKRKKPHSEKNLNPPKSIDVPSLPQTPQFAKLTLFNHGNTQPKVPNQIDTMATISRVDREHNIIPITPEKLNPPSSLPSNIETGSLVVLSVDDPNSPSKKMLQTYIAHGGGKLMPIAIAPTLLNSVVNYMTKSNASTCSSPQLTSPSSIASVDSRIGTPSVIQINPSPIKKQRHNSFSTTQ